MNFHSYNEKNLRKINKYSLKICEMEEKYQFLNEGFPKHCIFNSNTAKFNQNITLITLNSIKMLI